MFDLNTANSPCVYAGGGGGGSLTDVGRCGGRRSGIDLVMPSLKSLVSMATLSRRRSSSTTALNSSRGEPARLPSSAKSVTALPLLRDPPPPLRPVNRLRVSSAKMCSRCSSILSMASSSRYSINTAGFVPVSECRESVMCKLCLVDVPSNLTWTLQHCSCTFCIEVSSLSTSICNFVRGGNKGPPCRAVTLILGALGPESFGGLQTGGSGGYGTGGTPQGE